jgi:hypothetical protein
VSSFPWADFLQLAEDLAVQASKERSEGKGRTAVGRAYYATYLAARDYAKTKGIDIATTETSSHGKLWSALAGGPGKLPKLANIGRNLLKLRTHADYFAVPPVTSAHVTSSLAYARNAKQLLGEAQREDDPRGAV